MRINFKFLFPFCVDEMYLNASRVDLEKEEKEVQNFHANKIERNQSSERWYKIY